MKSADPQKFKKRNWYIRRYLSVEFRKNMELSKIKVATMGIWASWKTSTIARTPARRTNVK